MRILALLATFNERRFVAGCIKHLRDQGVDVYVVDNGSTDGTLEIAESYVGRGVVGIEHFPRGEVYEWHALLERKEQLARELDADWFMHVDADEVRLPPIHRRGTLVEAIEHVDAAGFNAVNFVEFTFVPTREDPDHDHAGFMRTLRTYYPFAPAYPHQLKAWKAHPEAEIAWSGGHKVRFPGLRMHPVPFPMRHYLFLSVPHAIEKYVQRSYDQREVARGWHGWRARIGPSDFRLPRRAEMRIDRPGATLDASSPRKVHYVDALSRTPAR